MSRWRLKSELERFPDAWLTFAQLAERLAAGVVDETDLVQSDYQPDWIPLDSVPGLLKAVLRVSRAKSSSIAGAESAVADLPSREVRPESPTMETRQVPLEKSPVGASEESERAPILFRPLPRGVTLGIVVVFGGGAWLIHHFWAQSRRFPVPRHVAERSSGWVVPLLGPVSFLELLLLIFDGIVLLLAVFWLLRRRLK